MPKIIQLSPHIANLIAAGEVVERPASVVKELLENAVDAGASKVTVEIRDGGMTFLRVTDNGCGMSPEDARTAFLRHATSKLRCAEDLAAIGTLGFRGEALAAIAAVSRVDIFSRQTGADCGAALHLEGGVPDDVTEAGCPDGTTVCVRDLFYNTPARMKFMKKDTAEAAAVTGVVTHLALSHPEVSFKLLRDGAEVLHTPGDGQLLSAIYAALGRDFNGSTFVGVGYDEEILVNAGIEECDFVAAVTQSDNANLMVVEIARRLYDVPHAVALLYDSSHERTYLQLGIDYVCGTTLVAEEIFSKAISGIGDHIATFGDFEVLQFALNLSEVGQKSIKVADLESRHGIRVCAFERADGTVSSIPSPSSILYHGDAVLAVVSHAMLPAIAKYAQD